MSPRSMPCFHPLRALLTLTVLAGVVVAVLVVPGAGRTLYTPGMTLTSAAGFTFSGTASNLAPGVASTLDVTASNAITAQLTVTSETVTLSSIDVTGTTTDNSGACPATNLTVGGHQFSAIGDSVTGNTSNTATTGFSDTGYPVGPSASNVGVWSPTISIPAGAPNGCQNTTFNFSYSGQATYTDTTTTLLAATSPTPASPINSGSTVTFSATVSPANGNYDSIQPYQEASPGDTVQFYLCPGANPCIETVEPLPSGGPNSVNYVTPPLDSGSYTFYAIYPGAGSGTTADFIGSTSNSVNILVKANTSCVTIPTAGVTPMTGTYKSSLTVASGETFYLSGGTIDGSVTVLAGGQLIAEGGTINGGITSSGLVELEGTAVNGTITSSSGGSLSVQSGSDIHGGVTASGSGAVCLVGTAASNVSIAGAVTVQDDTSVQNSVCGLSIQGSLTYTNNSAPAQIGGSSACPGNTITGSVSVQSNSNQLTIGSGAALGPVTTTNLYGVSENDPTHASAVGATGSIFSYGPSSQGSSSGSSWSTDASSTTSDLFGVSQIDSSHIWAAGANCTLVFSSNGGSTWTQDPVSGCTATLSAVWFDDSNHAWAVGKSGTIVVCTAHCNQASATWKPLAGGTLPPATDNFSGVWGNGSAVYVVGSDGSGNGTIWTCSANCNVVPDGPPPSPPPPAVSTWANVTPPTSVLPAGTALDDVASANNATMVVGANGTVLLCSMPICNSPSGWTALSGSAAPGTLVPGVNLVAVSASDSNNFLLAGNLDSTAYLFGCGARCASATAAAGPMPSSPPPAPPAPPATPPGPAIWAQVYSGTAQLNAVSLGGGSAAWSVGQGGLMLSCSSNCDQPAAVWTTYTQLQAGTTSSAFGNTVLGSITVENNTLPSYEASSTLQGNYASGSCTLGGDTPGIIASGNYAKGQNTCDPASGSA